MGYTNLITHHAIDLYHSACAYCWIKFLFSMLTWLIAFLIGIENQEFFAALVVLITIDLITGGIMVPFKTGVAIESIKILKTVSKLVAYSLLISAANLTENIIPGNTMIDIGAIAYLAMTEFVSILENFGNLGYSVPKKLLNRVINMKEK